MFAGLSAQVSNGTCNDELVKCTIETGRQLMDRIVALVRIRNQILAIVDRSDDRFAGFLIKEYLSRTELGCWCIKAIDEVAREKLFLHIIVIGIRIDEDVGERGCRISDVAGFREQP